ncbi:hypothetical protein WN943_018044 [Citrus x changshan-huyou]
MGKTLIWKLAKMLRFHEIIRFDIEGDVETQLNFTSRERTQTPNLCPRHPIKMDLREIRVNVLKNDEQIENLMEEIRVNFINIDSRGNDANGMVTPGNSDDVRFISSSASGHGILSHNSEVNSSRSNQKRPRSSSRHSTSGLESVAEE